MIERTEDGAVRATAPDGSALCVRLDEDTRVVSVVLADPDGTEHPFHMTEGAWGFTLGALFHMRHTLPPPPPDQARDSDGAALRRVHAVLVDNFVSARTELLTTDLDTIARLIADVEGRVNAPRPFSYRGAVARVVDGDTLDLDLDLGFFVTMRVRVRLLNVDTPEVYGVSHESEEYAAGEEASAFTADFLAANCTTDDRGRPVVLVRTTKTGKYGRWLADVYGTIPAKHDGITACLNDALIAAGYGRKA